jgi:RHS repeat-associated protein
MQSLGRHRTNHSAGIILVVIYFRGEGNQTLGAAADASAARARGRLAPTKYDIYDNVGNIKNITDNLDNNRSESFAYDDLNRLTAANSVMYGNLSYAYDKWGNLTNKEGIDQVYGADCGATGIHAICQSGTDTFTYDANGNMITRKGRDLLYDAEDRLKKVQAAGVDKESYWYDFSGKRSVKLRDDKTVVYTAGSYEIMIQADGTTELHTKYIYGAQGDLAAQITRDSSTVTLRSVTLASLNFRAEYLSASLAGWSSMGAVWFKLRHDINVFLEKTTTPFSWYLFVIFALSLFFVFARETVQRNYDNLFQVSTAMAVLMVFSFVFVFESCSGETEPEIGAAPWEDVTGTIPAGTPDLSTELTETYNDTWMGSQPIIGAYFFHPNHLGSVALVTDYAIDPDTGQFNPNLVSVKSEVHYKPYGERLYTDSSGPDMFKYKYTAQEEDPETSLMYYGARYYDPGLGRFITADSMVPGSDSLFKQNRGNSHSGLLSYHSNPKSPTLNRYMYVNGNPIQYKDPSGHIDWPGLLVGLAIIALGAAIIIFAAPIAAAIGLTAVAVGGFSISAASIVTGVGLAVGTLGYTIGEAAGNDCVSSCNIGFNTEVSGSTDWGQGGGSGGGSSGGGSSGGSGGKHSNGRYSQISAYEYDIPTIDLNIGFGWDLNGDSKLQKGEADYWWLYGGGRGILVDNSKIDWTGLTIPPGKGPGQVFSINTTDAFLTLRYETAATYGGTSFIVTGPSEVKVVDQLYHYEYRSNSSFENIMRNGMTWAGKPAGQGVNFMIYYYYPYIQIK